MAPRVSITDLPASSGQVQGSAKITLLLPTQGRSFDIYIGNNLLKSGVSGQFDMSTPSLSPGVFKYILTVRDRADPSRSREVEVDGIESNKTVTVDLLLSV